VARRPDVVVVGGGIVGAATAAFVARGGAKVTLVERDAVAAAASGRNSGVVQQPVDSVLAGLYRDSLSLYRDLAVDDAGFTIPTSPAGLLYASLDPDVPAALACELMVTHRELLPEFLDAAALRRLEPAIADGIAACRLAIGYPVEPGGATRAYAAIARRDGARVLEGESARLERAGSRVRVVVNDVPIDAGSIVVAAGPWTPALLDESRRWRPIRPRWGVIAEIELSEPPGHVIEEAAIDDMIEPATADGGDGAPDGRDAGAAARDARGGDGGSIGFSLVSAAGRSALGSTFLDGEPDPRPIVPRLVERGARFVPAIAHADVRSTRVCARPLSADGRPLIGRIPWLDDVYVAAGHGPWGISTGPGSARLVADLVLGRVGVPPSALDPARFAWPDP
jgi:glycine/D-amino acid oxidase-like deaminating enzyme